MKKLVFYFIAFLVIIYSCTDKWDDHYSTETTTESDNEQVEIVNTTAQEYLESSDDLSEISSLFDEEGIYDSISTKSQFYTILVYPNSVMESASIDDPEYFAQTSICDICLSPYNLKNGLSLEMWNGKYLDITIQASTMTDTCYLCHDSAVYISDAEIEKVVKTSDAYIYELNSPIYAEKSLYEVLEDLPDDYSLFKKMVLSYEVEDFDESSSTPEGVDDTGNTVYDSVFVTRNTLMDRYNHNGSLTWSMRSEYYTSTMLIPSNDLIEAALDEAYNYVIESLNRTPTTEDTTKFNEWIVESCFYDYALTTDELTGDDDLYSVDGYVEDEDGDLSSYSEDSRQWRPSIQTVDTDNPITLSNGMAYYVTNYKIPKNWVIYRIKSRFYIWSSCSSEEKAEYFQWDNYDTTTVFIRDYGSFGPFDDFPTVYYKVLCAYPSDSAEENELPVTLDYTGISLDDDDGTISKVMVPPGDYYLRMGFYSGSLPWTLDIYFNDSLIYEDFNPNSAHLDRYGVGYPYGFHYKDYYTESSGKSAYYDKDGVTVGTVTVTGDDLQSFKIKMVSNNMTETTGNRLYAYHWCLRPTDDNY